ncbi:MAG: hypothetical protein ACTSW1_07210 [Candidatus Hodarchaeales archaeon]
MKVKFEWQFKLKQLALGVSINLDHSLGPFSLWVGVGPIIFGVEEV